MIKIQVKTKTFQAQINIFSFKTGNSKTHNQQDGNSSVNDDMKSVLRESTDLALYK